jgi:glutaredoxin
MIRFLTNTRMGSGYMKTGLWAGIGLMLLAGKAGAVTIYECEDEAGNRSFQQACPPGTTRIDTRQVYTGPRETVPDMAAISAEAPVVFYSVPTCDACDLVRNYLDQRGIPFTENNVSNDIDLQGELMERTGELSVPVVMVGDQQISGYNQPLLESELNAAGYPEEAPAEVADAAPDPEPEPETLPQFAPIDPDLQETDPQPPTTPPSGTD